MGDDHDGDGGKGLSQETFDLPQTIVPFHM